jgi:hypothetical protein
MRKVKAMKNLSKALVGTVAAGAMAMTSASAMAQGHYYDRDDDNLDVGDIIAGALIIGGIAAVASAAGRDRYDRYDDRYRDRYRGRYDDRYYNRAGSPRSAVEQCVYAAERTANRYSYGGRAHVTDIRDVDRKRDGYRVKGRIAVNTRSNDWRRGWGNDYRGWDNRYSGYDAGKFSCDVRYGRVVDLDFDGIRGLR